MSLELTWVVRDIPAPQGSKRHVGRGILVESSKRVKPWRESVKHAALAALDEHPDTALFPITGPVVVEITFVLPRPKGHYRTGRNAHLLRDAAPMFPAGKPDIDKLARSTLDAITAADVFADDSQVVVLVVDKAYPGSGNGRALTHPGARVTVRDLNGIAAQMTGVPA